MKHKLLLYISTLLLSYSVLAQKTTTDFFKDLTPYKGYFDFYYLAKKDKVYLEVQEFEKEFLYVNSMSNGLGNNDLGLDRGQLGGRRVVYFKRAGDRVLLIEPNLKFRALTDNELEKKSVEEAFAKSILHAFKIVKEVEGKIYIDITPMLVSDAHNVGQRLQYSKQGNFKVDASRSAIYLERTKAFPKNVEFDAMVTFKGTPKGSGLRNVVPTPQSITLHLHHSFIALPEKNFKMRKFDPRSGAIPFTFYDYATPVEKPTLQRFIIRHRLEKKDPKAEVSEAIEPIVYYLDNGTPEPVRSALLEGGKWWNQAFESIGYKDAFQIKILPDDADPLDIRYNVIQWVHRSTRGWSYGASVVDPRTGEILKGHVSLGSLRIRQDFMIAQGLTDKPYAERDDNDQEMLDLALARIRQLSAHEIGHTLGFAHNFAASASNRASVMDYPHPLLKIKEGKVDYSDAYAVGIGEWDKVSVAYTYSDFADSKNETDKLNAILKNAQEKGIQYITDADARPQGGGHPFAHLWDNGQNPVDELTHLLEVRKLVFKTFDKDQLKSNEPYTLLEDRFVPQYFLHRYQIEAVAKWIGGLNYNYAVKNDGQLITTPISDLNQKKALNSLVTSLSPQHLAIPQNIQKLLPPRAFGYGRNRESFASRTGVSFDVLSVANTLSDKIIGLLFNSERASRLVQQNTLNPTMLSLENTIDVLFSNTFYKQYSSNYDSMLNEIVCANVLKYLQRLGMSKRAYPQVNAIVNGKLKELQKRLSKQKKQSYFTQEYIRKINAYFKNPKDIKFAPVPKIPDGSPIGALSCSDAHDAF